MKRLFCIMLTLINLVLLTGCQRTLAHEFKNDKNGRIAERFFPDFHTLPDTVQSEFEYKHTHSYEGYYLKLVFRNEEEYADFLEMTEKNYPDMTEVQRQQSYFIICNVRFKVDDYSFRTIDLVEYGFSNEPFVGLVANCDADRTIVFLYFWNEYAGIEDISDGLGLHGYMDYYSTSWSRDN